MTRAIYIYFLDFLEGAGLGRTHLFSTAHISNALNKQYKQRPRPSSPVLLPVRTQNEANGMFNEARGSILVMVEHRVKCGMDGKHGKNLPSILARRSVCRPISNNGRENTLIICGRLIDCICELLM